jgi:DNA repair photolyase
MEPQGALFDPDELADHHVGRGEFAGMEFIHTHARTIINELPKASSMPFRHTINVYRGCSHACSYCLAGDTRILMGDGRTRALAEVVKGDVVYGTIRQGAYRRYVRTVVADHWQTLKPAYRLTLHDGTTIVASGDHRFLTRRGWKHVTGTEQGFSRRPHLTPNDHLLGMGHIVNAMQETDDYRKGYLCGMIRGDGNLKRYQYEQERRTRVVYRFRLALADDEALERSQRYLSSFGILTTPFAFTPETSTRRRMGAIRTSTEAHFRAISQLVQWPTPPTGEWWRGFLAGVFDAEGSYSSGVLRISNKDATMLQQIKTGLVTLGFDAIIDSRGPDLASAVRLRQGQHEHTRFFHLVNPAISRKLSIAGRAVKSQANFQVRSIDQLGLEMPMYDLTTGTGDFIANGVISHNCFARPTHEFLGMGIGEDFERRILVKVNAVELLRAELAGRRWAGHHIAMGTNTDPYQRCEGKYHLTQGVVRVLSEAANPFSLLTKSTLILRDLELLAEAARRTDVRVNLSIGTLDEDVWRLTEPGTPSPRQRVEAVRRLNQAGVPCGVLVAPVLPGLSDRPDQLAEVVDACVGAGAVSISTVLLHLRPGVREHYLAWLTEHRPDLVADYERRYRRAYLPANEQRDLSDLVRRLVTDASGRYQTPRRVRWVGGERSERVRAQMMGPAAPRSPEARPPEVEPLNLSFE